MNDGSCVASGENDGVGVAREIAFCITLRFLSMCLKGVCQHVFPVVTSSIFSGRDTASGKHSKFPELCSLFSESWNQLLDKWMLDNGQHVRHFTRPCVVQGDSIEQSHPNNISAYFINPCYADEGPSSRNPNFRPKASSPTTSNAGISNTTDLDITIHLKPFTEVNGPFVSQSFKLPDKLVRARIYILLQLNDCCHAICCRNMSSSNCMSFFIPLRKQARIASCSVMP